MGQRVYAAVVTRGDRSVAKRVWAVFPEKFQRSLYSLQVAAVCAVWYVSCDDLVRSKE